MDGSSIHPEPGRSAAASSSSRRGWTARRNVIEEPRVSILLVDDDPSHLRVLEATLEPLGQDLVSASSGDQALKCLETEQVAVILLDVQMTGKDGFETARLVRESDGGQQTPIIFLTALDKDEAQVLRGYELGAVDYLYKPCIPEVLLGKVQVFVQLFRQHRRLMEMQETLRRYRELSSSGSATSVTGDLAGIGPLRVQAPTMYAQIVEDYRSLVVEYVDQLVVKTKKPTETMGRLITRIGDLGGGPRDLIDVHIHALDELVKGSSQQRSRSITLEGRLLAVEMMGQLVDYYRVGLRRPRAGQGEAR